MLDTRPESERRADRADHAGAAGEAGLIADPEHRFDAGTMSAQKVFQPEVTELGRGPGEVLVVGA